MSRYRVAEKEKLSCLTREDIDSYIFSGVILTAHLSIFPPPPSLCVPDSPPSPARGTTSRQYDHDRPFSFHKALRGDYGEDLQRLARDGLLSDYCPAQPDSTDHQQRAMDGAGGGLVKENGGVPGRTSEWRVGLGGGGGG